MATTKPGVRKLQILQALAGMLENPKAEKITTAALAAKTQISEAALYRHFASKAQMFEGLIEFIETSIFTLINQICEKQEEGLEQAAAITMVLLNFSEQNPGMTRVLIGDVLMNEDARLQLRMNQFFDRIELAYKQALLHAVSQSRLHESEVRPRSAMLASFVMGRWHRFAKSGFKVIPSEQAQTQIRILLASS